MVIRTPQNPFVRSGIRLAAGMVIVDFICVVILDNGPGALMASFAVMILLFFLDFEGGARQRLSAYGAASLVGLVALLIGVYAAPITWVAIVVTLPVSFAFAYARVLKGFIARCAVGLQLAYFLPAMLPANPADVWRYVGGWILGCVIAALCALVILPRQRLTLTRKALADWCRAAAKLTRLYAAGSSNGEGRAALSSAFDEIQAMTVGSPTRPGALTHRLRALLQMVQYANSSTNLAISVKELQPDVHVTLLADASATTFDSCAEILVSEAAKPDSINMDSLRDKDLRSAQEWCAKGLATDPAKTFDELRNHYPVRLIAILAAVMQWLALRSRGTETPMPALGAMESSSPLELLRVNLRISSPWFRNALRVSIAAAIAVGIAQAMGLKHGFWVVLATLSILQLSFTSPQTNRLALRMIAGNVAGITVGFLIIVLVPNEIAFFVVLAIGAFVVKYVQSRSLMISQFAFTPFAIVNLSLLTWPPSTDTVLDRITDVLVGLAVAIVLTFVIFPRGISTLITSTGQMAMTSMQAYLDSVLDALTGRSKGADIESRRASAQHALLAYADTLDAAFMSVRTVDPWITSLEARQAWLQDALLAGDVMRQLVGHSDELVEVPQIIATLDQRSGDRLDRMREVVVSNHAGLSLHPHAFVSAVWSGWWLDFLDRTKPADEVPATA
ncbi:MAG: FUSC family protein [Actinomycetes bacterium]